MADEEVVGVQDKLDELAGMSEASMRFAPGALKKSQYRWPD
jgi:hypothetical protein